MIRILYHYGVLRGLSLCLLAALALSSLALLRVGRTQTGPVELVTRRTLTSKTFRNPDGSLTLQAYGGPVHYYDATGALRDINLNLRAQLSGEYSYVADGIPFAVQVGPNATSPVRIAAGNDYVIYRLQGATVASAFINGNEVRYASALTQADKRHKVTMNGLKESLTLRTPLAPTSFSYLVETNLRIAPVANGLSFNRPGGEPVFFVPNPVAVDATGRRIEGMTYTLTPSGSNTLLSLSLPNVTGLVYPIEIDPTTTYTPWPGDGSVSNSGTDWTTTRSATVGNNVDYTSPLTPLGSVYNATNYQIARMFFAFDTGEIPDNAIISSTPPPTLQFNVALVSGTLFGNTTVHVVKAAQPKVWKLTISDYAAWDSDQTSKGSTDIGTTTGLKTINLSTSAINVFGITKLALRTAQDLNNLTPTTDGPWYQVNTSKETVLPKPVLSVTYTAPSPNNSVIPNETGLGVLPNVNYYGSGSESTNLLNGNQVVSSPAFPSNPGRAVTLAMNAVYNSQMWRDNNTLVSSDYPVGLGWRLTLGQIAWQSASSSYLYIDPTGARHALTKKTPDDGYYYSNDSTYLRYSDGSNTLWFKDGTKHLFNWLITSNQPDGDTRCITQIMDTNGNYIQVTYETENPPWNDWKTSRISQITDTANRQYNFSYTAINGQRRLTQINVYGAPPTPPLYGTVYFNYVTRSDIVSPFTPGTPVTRVMLNSIVFTNGQAVSLEYNASGELMKMNYRAKGSAGPPPPGDGLVRGYIRFDYQTMNSLVGQSREIWHRWTSADGAVASEKQYTFIPNVDPTMSNHAQTTVEDPTLNHTVHTFYVNQALPWKNGLENQTLVQQWSPGPIYTTLRTVDTAWTQDDPNASATMNPRPSSVKTTLEDSTTQSQVTIVTDAYGNTTQVKEFDYGSLTTAKRVTNTYYLQSGSPQIPAAPGYISKWILNRPIQIDITDDLPTPTTYARTTLSYDTYPSGQFSDTPGIINHDDFYDTFITMRGNVYSQTQGLAPDPIATAQFYYDTAGNVVLTLDPQGHQTQTTLDTTTNYTFPRLVTNALSQNVTLTTDNNTTLRNYTGLENQTISFLYDSITRPTQVNRPDGGYTTYSYNDTASPFSAGETTLIDNTQTPNLFLNVITYYDGFGRPIQRGTQRDASNWEWVQNVYDSCSCSSIGTQTQASNPYITGQTPVFTTTKYDALGRVTKIIPPDGTDTSNNIVYTYTVDQINLASKVRITDQAGKWKEYNYDALGRVTKVKEQDGADTRETNYTYNPLGQLLTITKDAQTRSFTYATSRGWLLTEAHPESGTTTYTYTTEGLLNTKTDAKGTVARYQYDNLHRLTGIRYDPNTFNDVVYTYDTVQISKLSVAKKMSSDGAYATEEHSYTYDTMGSILSETYGHRDSNTADPAFTFRADYQYNQLGNVRQILYPIASGRRRLDLTYNQMGRPTKIHNYYDGVTGVSPDFDVVNTLSYNAGGIVSSFNYGNNMTECRSYNNTRMQMTGQKLYTSLVPDCSNPGGATTAMDYTYNYPSANNGRLQSAGDNLDATKTQTFTYDSLNRLSQSTVGTTTTLTFTYDAYGNRTAQTATGSGPTMNLAYDTNNRITTTGYGYDPNGNLTGAPGSTVYNYDKENRLLSVSVASVTKGQYGYDGFGRRVSKISNIAGVDKQTFYFHTKVGLLGEYQRPAGSTQTPGLLKEYVYLGRTVVATMENWGATRKYYHLGRLGTTRKVTNDLGTVIETHDYYPFGENIASTENNKPKFTGYYRDDESGLDYAVNRYDNNPIGRFLTADPARPNSIYTPLELNKYTYVINDPINFIDPSGLALVLDPGCSGGGGDKPDKPPIATIIIPPLWFPPCQNFFKGASQRQAEGARNIELVKQFYRKYPSAEGTIHSSFGDLFVSAGFFRNPWLFNVDKTILPVEKDSSGNIKIKNYQWRLYAARVVAQDSFTCIAKAWVRAHNQDLNAANRMYSSMIPKALLCDPVSTSAGLSMAAAAYGLEFSILDQELRGLFNEGNCIVKNGDPIPENP